MSNDDEVDMEVDSDGPNSELHNKRVVQLVPSCSIQDKDPAVATPLASAANVASDSQLSPSSDVQLEVTDITCDKTSTESHLVQLPIDSNVDNNIMKQQENSPSSCESSLIPAAADTEVINSINLKDANLSSAAADVKETYNKALQNDVIQDKTVVAADNLEPTATEPTYQAASETDSESHHLSVVLSVTDAPLSDAILQENCVNDKTVEHDVSLEHVATQPQTDSASDHLPVSPPLTDAATSASVSSADQQEAYTDDQMAVDDQRQKMETTHFAEEIVCEWVPLGTAVGELPTNRDSMNNLPPLAQTTDHICLFDVDSFINSNILEPFPEVFQDKRSKLYVHLPYYRSDDMCKTVSEALKCLAEKQEIEFEDVHHAFQSILEGYGFFTNLQGLHDYLKTKSDDKCKELLGLMKKIAELALDLPIVCTQPIPLLRRHINASISMSQKQAACLLANAFYCTYPPTSSYHLTHLSFCGLYRSPYQVREKSQFAKLDCIFNYFHRVFESMPSGVITFRRQVLEHQDEPNWATSDVKIIDKLTVSIDGRIERQAPGMLHVDFANKCVGGGMLGEGCVQEEILFMLCPELIISRLLAEELDDNETLVMRGYERFSDYCGYAASFEFTGNYVDITEVDKWGRRVNEMVAMDALILWGQEIVDQLFDRNLKRELNKAYCGFRNSSTAAATTAATTTTTTTTTTTATLGSLAAVATGNWGCGAFGGDPHVKFLIQLMAASQAQRPVFYFTFHDDQLAHDIIKVHKSLVASNSTVGQLFSIIADADINSDTSLYESIIDQRQPSNVSTL